MQTILKKILPIAIAAILVVAMAVWFIMDKPEHIEDTNGADNYSLQTITDENICRLDVSALNVVEDDNIVGEAVTYKSKKFSGVYEVFTENIVTNRYEITVNHAKVNAGNFKMVLCVDDKIVHTFKLNELSQTFVLENVKGSVSLRIAGESADFMFDYSVN